MRTKHDLTNFIILIIFITSNLLVRQTESQANGESCTWLGQKLPIMKCLNNCVSEALTFPRASCDHGLICCAFGRT